MSKRQIPEKLRAARRALDIIPAVKVLQDWIWNDIVKFWFLHCEISVESDKPELIPEVTEWYVLVSSDYPWGQIEFFPSKKNGLARTFLHQTFNSSGKPELPWRSGNICLSTSLSALDHNIYNIEPYEVYRRLHWRFERAIQWLNAASKGRLASPGDHFELPFFPVESRASLVFTEGNQTFAQWQQIPNSVGIVDLMPLYKKVDTLFIRSFKSANGQELLSPMWGKAMNEMSNKKVTGIWVRLNQIPVLEPWQAPSNWKELRGIFRALQVDLDEQLSLVLKWIRDEKSHLLLIGFPISSMIGESPSQMHWQPIELPVLSTGTMTARGFRTNELGYWQRDRTEILRRTKKLFWGRSENWHSEEISTRGRFSKMIANKQVLLIGAGAVGSVVAELLVRGNVKRITLMDSDKFEAGNLSRHTLDLRDIEDSKAIKLARRLNLASPHAVVEAIECKFPFLEERKEYIQQCDLLLDCTGSDFVLQSLASFSWQSDKIFISISLGMGGKRLFCFVSQGMSFPVHIFKANLEPWLERERNEFREQDLPWSGVGCWHPVFPARIDDVWMMSSIAVKHIEALVSSCRISDELSVFEQAFDENNTFCGVHLVNHDGGK